MAYAWIIGAAEACDICRSLPYVSRKHCRLAYVDGRARSRWQVKSILLSPTISQDSDPGEREAARPYWDEVRR